MGSKLVLPLQVRVDLRAVVMKGYSTFSEVPKLEPHHQIQFSVISRILVEGRSYFFCRDAVGIFYSPSWLGSWLGEMVTIVKERERVMWRFRNYQRTPNRMLTRRLPDTKCINASPRIRLHASIRLKSEKRKIIKCKVANEKRSRQN